MNEPKKRGRPPVKRCPDCGRKEGEGHYDDCPIGMGVLPKLEGGDVVSFAQARNAQAYALRVWNGQSVTEPRPWRIQRVKEALEAQGLSMEGVELP